MQIIRWFETAKDRDAFIEANGGRKATKHEHKDAAKIYGFDERQFPFSLIQTMPKGENEI